MSEEIDSGIFILAKQGSITFFGNILGKIFGFLFIAIATRLVSPSEYGIFTLTLSIVLFVQGFASLNIYRSVDYFVPQFISNSKYGRARTTLRNVFSIGTLASIIGLIAVFVSREYLAALFDEPELAVALSIFVLLIPLQTIHRILMSTFNSIKRMEYRVIMKDILNPVARTGAMILLVMSGMGLMGLISGYLLGVGIAVILGLLLLRYEIDWIRNTTSGSVSNTSLLSYSLPLVLAGVIYSLVGQVDYFVIGFFLESTEVGQYQVGFMLASNLLIALNAITPVFKPMIAETTSEDALLRNRFRLATRWVTMLTIPLSLTLALAPDLYLSLLFTEQYTAAAPAVIALSIGYLLNASFGPEGMMLEGLGHTRLTLVNTLLLIGVNGILDVLLVPSFGIVGAGVATATGLTVAGIAGIVEVYYMREIHPFSWQLARIWVATALPLVVGVIIVALVEGIILVFTLPILIVLGFVIGLRWCNGFTTEDARIATQVDDRLGYPLVKRTLMPNISD